METAGSGAKRFEPAYMEVEGDYHRSHYETGGRRDGRPREYEERGAGSSGRQEDWDRWPREQMGRDGQRLPYDDRRREPLKSDYGWKSRDDERVCVCGNVCYSCTVVVFVTFCFQLDVLKKE